MTLFSGSSFRKLQLWSDAHEKEFAVRLSNEQNFRAISNPDVKYTKLVEEAEYFSDMDYDWKYLLEHWVGVRTGSIPLLDDGDGNKSTLGVFDLANADTFTVEKPDGGGAKREKPQLPKKCRYCMLSYNSERERREHEVAWHSEKMKKDSNRYNSA
jgi:hypothetical protein